MVQFILNNQQVKPNLPVGTTILDFIRYHKHLKGTKIGCREGDCGACTVLVGELVDGELRYQSMTSCLMPLENAHGKHIVSVEGINQEALSPVQQVIVEEGGTQCGFCTIGFVMSLTGFAMNSETANSENAIASIDGNICRCTGYKSLERAAARISEMKKGKPQAADFNWLVQEGFLPAYFKDIKSKLEAFSAKEEIVTGEKKMVGGGTDLYVQRPEEMAKKTAMHSFLNDANLRTITEQNGHIYLGAAATAEDIRSNPLMQQTFPNLREHMKLVSSTPIRNMATIGGNFVNASPIGDMTIFFLALDATLLLTKDDNSRIVKLRHFYKGYKQLDLEAGEHVEQIYFKTPPAHALFNFEKVCKRTHLDIASVNSACLIFTKGDVITGAHLSAGGLAATPKYLAQTALFLAGKQINAETLFAASQLIQTEVSPISDARGSAEYKRLLLRQLFYAHFLKLFPGKVSLASLTQAKNS